MNGRFLVNRRDAKVMGVAAGLADYTGVDPLVIRLGFVAATLITGPVMILLYVLTGWLAPRPLKISADAGASRAAAIGACRRRRFAMRKLLFGLTVLALAMRRPTPRFQVGAKAPDFVTTGAVGGKPFKLHLKER